MIIYLALLYALTSIFGLSRWSEPCIVSKGQLQLGVMLGNPNLANQQYNTHVMCIATPESCPTRRLKRASGFPLEI